MKQMRDEEIALLRYLNTQQFEKEISIFDKECK